jgi:hypothetical protein
MKQKGMQLLLKEASFMNTVMLYSNNAVRIL